LIPVVVPNNSKATLSNVIGELGGQQDTQWKMILPGNDQSHDVSPLVAMLRLMWPNHDRRRSQRAKTHAFARRGPCRGDSRRHYCGVAP
jgi:hypothetical protein